MVLEMFHFFMLRVIYGVCEVVILGPILYSNGIFLPLKTLYKKYYNYKGRDFNISQILQWKTLLIA